MYKIVKKKSLNPTVTLMEIDAPLIAKKAQPGQFIILRVDEDGERIPLTVAGYDREKGTDRIIFQIVGATTEKLNHLNEGDCLHDFVGPLGVPTHTDGYKKVCVVGGGVGCAIALPIAEKLHELGVEVHSIVGFRNKDLVILEDEFKACSDKFIVMTDDGSHGRQGVVTTPLEEMIKAGENYDLVITIGPLIMMKFVVKTTKPYNIPTTVSMNPIMIDGTCSRFATLELPSTKKSAPLISSTKPITRNTSTRANGALLMIFSMVSSFSRSKLPSAEIPLS